MRKPRRPRPQPDRALTLTPVTVDCPECRHRTYADYNNFRTITTLDGVFRLTLTIRRCPDPACPHFLRPYRPEAEPHFALPYHEFGLDVMALVGPALPRIRPGGHGAGGPAPLCRASEHPRAPPRADPPRPHPRRAHRHQPA